MVSKENDEQIKRLPMVKDVDFKAKESREVKPTPVKIEKIRIENAKLATQLKTNRKPYENFPKNSRKWITDDTKLIKQKKVRSASREIERNEGS